jgi:hypothetical protein
MACQKCKNKKRTTIQLFEPRTRWTKKLVNTVSLMYEDVYKKRQKTNDDWKIIFDVFREIFPSTSITDHTNIRLRGVVSNNLNAFYKDFVLIREEKLQ